MSLWKSIFGGDVARDNAPPPQALNAQTLQIGNIVKFGFAAQAGLSNQRCRVVGVKTYDLGGDAKKKGVLLLEGSEADFSLAVVKQGHRDFLEVGISILPAHVKELFDLEEFARIFDPEVEAPVTLERLNEPESLAGWTGGVYYQELGHQAYISSEDYRHRYLTTDTADWEMLDYALLVSEDRRFAVQTEVYDGGRTEVSLLVYLPLDKIEEMWAA